MTRSRSLVPRSVRRSAVALALGLSLALLATSSLQVAPTYAGSQTAGGYTTNATVTPTAPTRGGTVNIVVSVTSAASSTALIDVEVGNAGGVVQQQVFDAQAFSAGQTRTFNVSWATTAQSAIGGYTIRVGVFSPGWGTLYHWNDTAATFTLGGGGATPTPSGTPMPTATPTPTPGGSGLPALPAGWPTTLQLGWMNSPGNASEMRGVAPFGFRYQYLAGGVNTGSGWATWNPNGDFATYYIQESVQAGITPVFTFYQMVQSAPGNGLGEADGALANLQNTATMTAYYADLKLFLQRAGAFGGTRVVLQFEPDLWGFIEQRATNDNAASVPAKVAATGVSELSGLPDTAAGFARAAIALRNRYAPNVLLAYHISGWGTGDDIVYSDPPDATVDALATKAAAYYSSLGANFDLAFAEFSDRDAGFKQYQYGDGGASWWDEGDFNRNLRFLTKFVSITRKRVVMWQIPLGNTKMRAMDNSWGHYQDNRVEWLLDEPGRTRLSAYIQAGVIAFLFGQGASGATCACDAIGDGVTNPSPITNNSGASLNADDDGGFFRQKAAAYYSAGAMSLASGSPTATPTATPRPSASPTATPTATPRPTATPTPTATPRPSATPTATPRPSVTPTATPRPSTTPTPTPIPPAGLEFTTSATAPASVARGGTITIAAHATATLATSALVDLEIYDPLGNQVAQRVWDGQTFRANQGRNFSYAWQVPTGAIAGTYTVKLGIFQPGWAGLYTWNDAAETFIVTP